MSVSFSNTLQENGEKKTIETEESSSEDAEETLIVELSERERELLLLNNKYRHIHENKTGFKREWVRDLLMRKDFEDLMLHSNGDNSEKWWKAWNEDEILIIERWLKSLKATGIGCLPFWTKDKYLLSRVAGKLALSNFLYDKGFIGANDDLHYEIIKNIRVFVNNTYRNEIFISEYCRHPFTSSGFHKKIDEYIGIVLENFENWQENLVNNVIIPETEMIQQFQQTIPENSELFWERMYSLYKQKDKLFKKYYTETSQQTSKNCSDFCSSRVDFSFGCVPKPSRNNRAAVANEAPDFFDDTTILWEKYEVAKRESENLDELVDIEWKLFKVYESRLAEKNPNYFFNVLIQKDMPIINIKDYNPKDGQNCSCLCYWVDFLELIYGIFICSLLSYLPVTDIIEFEKDRTNIILLIEFFFNIIPLLQFISGNFYYNSPHFRGFLINRLNRASKRHNEFNRAPCHTMWITMGLTVLLSSLYALMLLFFYESDDLEILMGTFYCFWSVPSIIYNASLFYMVFTEHLSEIKWICKRVEEGYGSLTFSNKKDDARKSSKNIRFQKSCIFENFPEQKDPIDINELVVRISDFRNDLETSFDAFNAIYSYSSLFGFIGTTFILATTVNNIRRKTLVFEFLNDGHVGVVACVWSVVFCFFTYIAKQIEDKTLKLKELLSKPFYTQLFLRRHKDIGVHDNIMRFPEWKKDQLLSRKQTDITLDWAVLNDVIKADWYKFNVFGFTIVPNIKKVSASIAVSLFVAVLATI